MVRLNTRRLSLLPLLVVVAGCTGNTREEPTRIGSLDNNRTEVTTTRAKPIDESEALENYRRYLELAEDSQERQEALRRVADLNVEVEASGEAGVQEVNSIAYYQDLLQRFPDSAANERVLYQLARAYELDQQPQQALATFEELLRRYPRAEAADEIRFRRAELLFRERRYAEAEAGYSELLAAGKGSRFYEKALYKIGWSRYKQSRYVAALAPFDQLLRDHPDSYSDTGIRPGSSSEAQRILLEDSIRTMALSLSLLGTADQALQRLEQMNNPPYDRALRVRLAALYQQKERYTDAAQIFATEAQRGGSPDDALRAIAAFEAGGFDQRALDAKAQYLQNWPADHPGTDTRTSADWSRQLARHHHALAQRNKQSADYASAEQWYRYYLQHHAQQPDSAELRFLLAELLFEQKRYAEAATAYAEAAQAGGGRTGDAAYAAVLARRGALEALDTSQRTAQLPAVVQQDLEFAQQHPQHPQAQAVTLRAAEDLYRLGNQEAALAAASGLTTSRDSSIRIGALQIVAAQATAAADYPAAEQAWGSLVPLLEPGAERSTAEAALATALYRQGEAAQQAGDSDLAIRKFLEVGRRTPDAPIRAAADYDAATLLLAAERWDQAAGLLEAFRVRFPTHELAGEAQRKLALAYQNSGRNLDAARALTGVARSGSGDVARAADWQAAELLRQARTSGEAIVAYENYLNRYPQDVTRGMEARRHLADLEAESGKGPKYRQRLEAIISADAAAGEQRSERSRTLAAQASMELALEAVAAFEATPLQLPLDRSLQAKTARLEAAQAALTRTANYGVAEVSTAATYRIAELYRQLSRELMASPRPRNLDAEAREQYAVLLEERAFPLEEQAMEIHERNISRARQGDYDSWIQRSYQALLELAPAQYGQQEQPSDIVEKW